MHSSPPLPSAPAFPVADDADDDRAPVWVCALVWVGASAALWAVLICGVWYLLVR